MARLRRLRRPSLDANAVLVGFGMLSLAAAWLLAAAIPAASTRGFGDEHVVQVTGSGHAWRVRYPGPDGELGTVDDIQLDGDLHLPRGVRTRIVLCSRDYVYTLRVKDLGVDDVALPDMPCELTIDAPDSGTYALQGGQLCGVGYPGLQGYVVVHEGSDYWTALRLGSAR